jgi:hypothetical protein
LGRGSRLGCACRHTKDRARVGSEHVRAACARCTAMDV